MKKSQKYSKTSLENWKRFLDNCFVPWTKPVRDLESLHDILNNLHTSRDPRPRMLRVSGHIDECASNLIPRYHVLPFHIFTKGLGETFHQHFKTKVKQGKLNKMPFDKCHANQTAWL